MFAGTAGGSAVHNVRFTLRAGVTHRQVLAHTRDIQLRYVLVNGNALLLGDQITRNEAYMYGYGVMLRFWQRGTTHYVDGSSLAPNTKRVMISFH